MSPNKLICFNMALLMAAGTLADPNPAEKTAPTNWQWSVVVVKEPTPDLDTLVLLHPASDQKTEKTVEKACDELKSRLSELANSTFYDNPPFVGSIIVTVTVRRKIVWPVLNQSDDDRAYAITRRLIGDEDIQELDQGEDLPGEDTPYKDFHGNGRNFELTAAKVNLIGLDSMRIAVHECPRNDEGRPELNQLAQIVASDMVRYAARIKEMAAPLSDSSPRR